jgi:glycosyltransferase involved in cell wall biosynthesis
MNVWVFQTGEPLPVDEGNYRPMRAMNLSNQLVSSGHNVVLWSSDFFHQEKIHRYGKDEFVKVSDNLEVRLIPSRGYSKNIGLERLIDHAQLALHLRIALKKAQQLPDVAFVGYPPIETAYVLIKWLKRKNVPVLLDIKDQWPSIFVEALPKWIQPFGVLAFYPYFHIAKKCMRMATGISAMADSFLSWGVRFAGRKRHEWDAVFPLTTPISLLSVDQCKEAETWWDQQGVIANGQAKVCFVGSLSPAFDFVPIQQAAELALRNNQDIQFIICGDGGSAQEIKNLMRDLPNVIMPGWIDRPKIEILASRCYGSLTPYLNVNNFTTSIPNKILDALSLRLPLLSPLTGEVENLILKHKVGFHYEPEGDKTLYNCLLRLINEPRLRSDMSKNARKLYDTHFSYETVYSALVRHLELLSEVQSEITR